MSGWLNWMVLLVGIGIVFSLWSWVPLHKLDRQWQWNNAIFRPFLHTMVLTGGPAYYAKATGTPVAWLLIPLCFFLTQYAVLSGRFLKEKFVKAGWVMVLTTVGIWIVFFMA